MTLMMTGTRAADGPGSPSAPTFYTSPVVTIEEVPVTINGDTVTVGDQGG